MTYFDEKGNIRSELLDQEARQSAAEFVPRPGNRNARENVKNSQLRRFFGEFKGLKNKFDQQQGSRDDNFLAVKPLVKMVNAKVAYAEARGVVTVAFKNWLQRNVGLIESAKDFDAFLLHFEAVIGFCYELNPRD
jgi:CRISPR-associated protein Csm2